jgi:alpha-1,3-rhamnosyl/mannosyltransferase
MPGLDPGIHVQAPILPRIGEQLMRVLFNASAALAPPLTGVGHYARNLLRALAQLPDLDITCFNEGRAVPAPADAETVAVSPPRIGMARRALRSLAWRTPYLPRIRRRLAFMRLCSAFRDAIYHEPNHILLPFAGRTVVTIHDISVLHYPQFHPAERVEYFNRHLHATVARADRILTDSAFISRDLQKTMGVDAARIRVVPLGVAPAFRPTDPATIAPRLAGFRLQPGRYLVAVGTREPRKNLERLLDAYLGLPQSARAAMPLAVVGPAGWRAEAIEARLDAAERAGEIRRLGYLSDDDRVAVTAGAAGLAYPSIYEGFGLPPLEAACCGVPVLTSRNSPMEEMLGEAAVLVDPLDVDAIRQGLARLVDDAALRRRAVAEAADIAARFTWEACAARTSSVYRELQ